jgi:membrane associated rhomboid family serine protease
MFDRWLPPSQDHLPLTWWRQQPVYLAAILALGALASMILTALLGPQISTQFIFSYESFFRQYHLWTPFTYPFFNPPSLWTIIGCYLLWNFGEAVERHIGRRAFVRLLALLWLVSPVIISLVGVLGMGGFACAGIMAIEFAIFIAFATLYPTAKVSILIVTLDAWVLAAILVGVNVLQSLFVRDLSSLILLASSVGTAYAFIRFEKGELTLPSIPKPSLKAAKPAAPASKPAAPSVDDILDKIGHQGMHSLTTEERRILDKASREMRKRR